MKAGDSRPERIGRLIWGTVTFGLMGALAGFVWALALGFDLSRGALLGGVISATIVFVLLLGLSSLAAKGMALMFGGAWGAIVVIGLLVWLVRSIIG